MFKLEVAATVCFVPMQAPPQGTLTESSNHKPLVND